MKKITCLLIVLTAVFGGMKTAAAPAGTVSPEQAATASPEASPATKKQTVRVLAIGNSFSEDAVEQNLHEIAAADGINMIVGNLYIGGCTIDRHVTNIREDKPDYRYRKVISNGTTRQIDNCPLSRAIRDEKWDFISVQQASGVSGLYDSYRSLGELVEWVRRNAPQATVVFHRTWAYSSDSEHQEFPNYGCDQMRMYQSILDASSRAVRETGIKLIVPAGTAIQNARQTALGQSGRELTRDGYHLDRRIGRYIAAATWYEALTGRTVEGNAFCPDNVTPEELAIAQRCAHNAVAGIGPDSDVEIRGSVGMLKGSLRVPEMSEGGHCPAVIICHGFTGNRNEKMLISVADSLQARGIASVRFDFNGHGQSEGAFEDMTVINELEDVGKILKYVENLEFVDRIGILGHSQGGLVTGLAAPAFGAERLSCAVLMAPAANIHEGALAGNLLGVDFDPVNPPATISVWSHTVGLGYLKTAQMLPVFEEAAKYTGPACIIHGTADTAVPCISGQKYDAAMPCSELHLLDGFDHGFNQGQPRAVGIAASFLAGQLLQ